MSIRVNAYRNASDFTRGGLEDFDFERLIGVTSGTKLSNISCDAAKFYSIRSQSSTVDVAIHWSRPLIATPVLDPTGTPLALPFKHFSKPLVKKLPSKKREKNFEKSRKFRESRFLNN
jgi:hypothetical protein